MVRDVDAPSEVIWSRILDFEAYPRMIKGCDDCRVYATEQTDGQQVIGRIRARARYY